MVSGGEVRSGMGKAEWQQNGNDKYTLHSMTAEQDTVLDMCNGKERETSQRPSLIEVKCVAKKPEEYNGTIINFTTHQARHVGREGIV